LQDTFKPSLGTTRLFPTADCPASRSPTPLSNADDQNQVHYVLQLQTKPHSPAAVKAEPISIQ